MKILIADTYYKKFLLNYSKTNNVDFFESYEQELKNILDQCFGTSFFYSKNLNDININAVDIIINYKELQELWVKQYKQKIKLFSHSLPMSFHKIPFLGNLISYSSLYLNIVYEQIKFHRPDVLYVQDINVFPSHFLEKIKKFTGIIVGQVASPLPPYDFLKKYDLILTSFPHFVPYFQSINIKSEYFRIGFEQTVLNHVSDLNKDIDVSFVGGIGRHHTKAIPLFLMLTSQTPIQFFGYGAEELEKTSPILKRHHGEVWGLDMYRALARSKITLNRHINVAQNNANNMRLYEATGMGALLITDYKDNLNDLFEIGKEVIAYRSNDEAVKLINYYINHPDEAQKIAMAGQARTLRDHTYKVRMQELVIILKKYLGA